MEVVYTRRSGSIRSMPVQSEAERQLNFERQQRARTEAELLEARQAVIAMQTRLAMTEAALDECRAELAAERARVVVAPEPVVELIEPTPPKRLGRPRKAIAETIQTEPEPVRWWAKGSKWDTADE
jgi:hypothetical protein